MTDEEIKRLLDMVEHLKTMLKEQVTQKEEAQKELKQLKKIIQALVIEENETRRK